jgi:ATP-binding cassette ChvD family protein
MAGVDHDFQGEAWPHQGTKIGYLSQVPELDASKDVRGNVEEAVASQRAILKEFEDISMKFAEPMSDDEMEKLLDKQGRVQEQIDAHNLWELDRKIEIAMDALRLPPGDAAVDKLSGGEKRRVALCRTLLEEPDMLLLDEPTNHLDAESVAWLERYLAEFPGTVVAVTHDRYFLDNVAKWILELDRGYGIPWEGNYTSWLEQKKNRLATEEKQQSARQRTLEHELEWVRMAPRARQAKSKARLQQYEELASEKQNEKIAQNEIVIPPAPRLGNDVVIAKNLAKAYGDKVLFDDLNFALPRGGIVGVIGPNGAGKTTLFRMIVGEEKPDGGSLKVGETVQLAYVDQGRVLDGAKTVYDEVSGGSDTIQVGKREINARGYLSSFGFKGSDQQKAVSNLSGGERNRLHLAKLLKSGGNLLLLDEPTNDLDVDTLRALEDALLDFSGCAVVISHDRWFLDRIATHMLAFEGDSEVVWFEGNYQAYIEDLKKRKGPDADQPHRIKYKALVRG